jgi:gentisate 1,2-dioxygenase
VTQGWQGTPFDGISRLPGPSGEQHVELFSLGNWSIELYAPKEVDDQNPHDRDEVYVVVAGEGTFAAGEASHPFGPGDILFVPAGLEHRFVDFTEDLVVWVIFGGPVGGEATGAGEG